MWWQLRIPLLTLWLLLFTRLRPQTWKKKRFTEGHNFNTNSHLDWLDLSSRGEREKMKQSWNRRRRGAFKQWKSFTQKERGRTASQLLEAAFMPGAEKRGWRRRRRRRRWQEVRFMQQEEEEEEEKDETDAGDGKMSSDCLYISSFNPSSRRSLHLDSHPGPSDSAFEFSTAEWLFHFVEEEEEEDDEDDDGDAAVPLHNESHLMSFSLLLVIGTALVATLVPFSSSLPEKPRDWEWKMLLSSASLTFQVLLRVMYSFSLSFSLSLSIPLYGCIFTTHHLLTHRILSDLTMLLASTSTSTSCLREERAKRCQMDHEVKSIFVSDTREAFLSSQTHHSHPLVVQRWML